MQCIFNLLKNNPEDRDEGYSSEFHPFDPIVDVSLFNTIEKNNDQICSETSQSNNALTTKELEIDIQNLLEELEDMSSEL